MNLNHEKKTGFDRKGKHPNSPPHLSQGRKFLRIKTETLGQIDLLLASFDDRDPRRDPNFKRALLALRAQIQDGDI